MGQAHRQLPRGAVVLALTIVLVVSAGVGLLGAPTAGAPVAAPAAASARGVPTPAAASPVEVAPAFSPPAGIGAGVPAPANASMTVDVGLASRDPAGLASYVNATAVPGTGLYRQFLSPGVASARFGAAPGALAAAEAYFDGFGLATVVHPDGLLLSVSGSAPAVGRAFGTTLEQYRSPSGATFLAHPTVASLPAIAPWTGVVGLDTETAAVPGAVLAPSAGSVEPLASCSGSTYLTPCEVGTAYDFPWTTGGVNGTGTTIAVVDAYSSAETQNELNNDFNRFSSDEGLPTNELRFAYPVPTTANLNESGTNPDWSLEDALDVEWSHAGAPGATITMVYSPNAGPGLYFAIDWIVATHAADVISLSWGEPEVGTYNAISTPCSSACNASSDGSFAILNPVLELAAAEGISSFAASGDCGAAGGTSGVSVNYPASSPYITGVGATNLTVTSGGVYGSEIAWGGNASGARGSGCQNQGGSGGGYSVLPRPWWQTGEGTDPSEGRGVPDVAIVGGSGSPVLTIVGGGEQPLAGTSVSTPIWAGVAADADQAHGSSLGWLNPSLYTILGGPSYGTDFHDILGGWNGYHAHAGWDPITGIGTPVVGALVTGLTQTTATPSGLGTFAYASPRFGSAPLTVRFAVTARGGTGSYSVEGVAFGDGNASAVTSGTVTHTFADPGVYAVQSYVVDSDGNTSASPPVVVVVGGGGPLSVQLSATLATPAVGANDTFTATVSGGSGSYAYSFWFGDGAFDENLSVGAATHAFVAPGAYCAEVVAQTTSGRLFAAASARVPIAVGGATPAGCGNPSTPLTLTGNTSVPVRDAPADFPDLFTAAGGSTAPDNLAPQVSIVAVSPSDPYLSACKCAILRAPGTYELEEWENDTVNGEASAYTNVTVVSALSATFHASVLSGPVPLTVDFSASATGGYDASATATRWSFGNGGSEVGATASTTYSTAGEYVAIASLSDRGYGNASEAFVIDAEAVGSTAAGIAGAVSPAVNVSSGETVRWNATVVGPSSATAGLVLAWNLGNGGSAYGPNATETYFAPLDLLADDQLVASVSLETGKLASVLTVPLMFPDFFATESSGFVPAVDDLGLTEVVYPNAGVYPLVVTGQANATGPAQLSVPSWLFGDGGSATGSNVSHPYYAAGDFSVQVEIYDGFANIAYRQVGVAVNAPLTLPGCSDASRSGTAPYSVVLAPEPTGGAGAPYTYRWTLPNGTTSAASNVTLRFGSAGTYPVSVVVTDAANLSDRCTWSIVVTTLPAVSFAEVVAAGVAVGAALVVVFLWATRPRVR